MSEKNLLPIIEMRPRNIAKRTLSSSARSLDLKHVSKVKKRVKLIAQLPKTIMKRMLGKETI